MNAPLAQEQTLSRPIVDQNQDDLFLVDDLNRLAADKNLTHAALAKEIGIAASTLSEIRAGKYRGNLAGFLDKIRNWVTEQKDKDEIKAIAPVDPPHFYGPTALRVRNVLRLLKFTNKMGVIYGDAGVGKTKTARQFQQEVNDVHIVTLKSIDSNARSTLQRIASDIGIGGGSQDYYSRRIFQTICSKLTQNSILIIDEAQHTDIKAIDSIRAIHDEVGCGIVLIGNRPLFRTVFGDTSGALAQLHSRVALCIEIGRPTDEDVSEFCKAWGVPVGKSADFIKRIAQEPGGLRSAANLTRNACMIAEKPPAAIEVGDLKLALQIMRPH